MLSAAMLLSVGAYADDGIVHRYPEFTFTATVSVKGTEETFTFTMPAWDAYVSTEIEGNGMGYRMQLIENPTSTSGKWRTRIVGSRVFSNEKSTVTGDYWFASFTNSTSIVVTKPDGSTLETTTGGVTYGDIFGIYDAETNPTGVLDADKNAKPFVINKTTSTSGDLVIQKERLIQGGKWKNYTFKIVEIGDGAFRNTGPTNTNVSSVTGTVTIPNTIEKIGNNAFRHGIFNKVVFEEGSQVTTIENATFEGCVDLEEVVIPASVTTIKGTAFGSCAKLNKVVFEGNLPTLTKVKEEPSYSHGGTTMPEGGYNIFQGAFRFQTGHDGTVGKDVTPSKCIIEVPLGTAKSYINSNDGLFAQFPMSSKFEMSKQYTTYCSDLDFTFKQYDTSASTPTWTDGSLKVYYVKESDVELQNSKVNLSEITGDFLVPGWKEGEGNDFGVVLKGVSGETYNIFYPNGNGITSLYEVEEDNCLHGCIESTPINVVDDNTHTYFVLSNGVFRQVETNGSCKANKAYIMISGKDISGPGIDNNTESRGLALSFPDDDPTGITTLETQCVQNDAYYTLQGIQVKQPQKGIVIKNGKKYIFK